MTQRETYPPSAREAYDAFAPIYDEFTEANDYEKWLGEVLFPEMEKHGLKTGWALDAGCGTGRAFEPLLRRGWSVCGRDASPAMVSQALEKMQEFAGRFEGSMRVGEGDVRDLPRIRPGHFADRFDLVLLLNDVLNYLTEDGDLERCFSGVARNLAPGGLVCFDANTLGLMRSNFGGVDGGLSRGDWEWRGRGEEIVAGGTFEATLSGPGVEPHVHRQRHWTHEQILAALEASGLSCLARLGQREDGERIILDEVADEYRDVKVIYIGGHREE